jgi:hypothetical protein
MLNEMAVCMMPQSIGLLTTLLDVPTRFFFFLEEEKHAASSISVCTNPVRTHVTRMCPLKRVTGKLGTPGARKQVKKRGKVLCGGLSQGHAAVTIGLPCGAGNA